MKLISRLLLWQKFIVLGALALVLAGIPFVLYFSEAQKSIDFARDEQHGIAPLKSVGELYVSIQEHRALSAQVLSGSATFADKRDKKQAETDARIEALEAVLQRDQWSGQLARNWQQFKADWKRSSNAVTNRSVDAMGSIKAHEELIRGVARVREALADYYKLSLDPEGFTFYMMKTAVYDLNTLTDPLSALQGTGSDLLQRTAKPQAGEVNAQQLTDAERLALVTQIARARDGLALVNESIGKSIDYEAELKGKLDPGMKVMSERVGAALKLAEDTLVNAPKLSHDPVAYRAAFAQAGDATVEFNSIVIAALDEALIARVGSGKRGQFFVSAVVLLLAGLGAALSVFIVRSVLRPVGHLVGVMEQVAKGETGTRARLGSGDEIGQLARQFDTMMDEREQAAAIVAKEHEQLNNSVLGLVQAVAQLARKDLTIKVPVAEDVTGAVGDALNLLTSETSKVLSQVTNFAVDVSAASLMVKQQSDAVTEVASNEREQVERAAVELGDAAASMKRIAELAQACNTAADNAIKTTQNALSTVNATVGGISGIRDTIRETEKRIKRLGERSQEISGVVSLINTIAERTHILALNASMHAASAGEAGRGFAVVADEVQRLAENARQATAQIATLVNNIQVETADTVNTMNATISQVVEGSKLAEQAGEQMKRTQETTAELVASVQQIAESSNAQARVSAQLLERAGEIRKSTEQTTAQLREQSEQTVNLVEYAKGLMGAVRVFKLPG